MTLTTIVFAGISALLLTVFYSWWKKGCDLERARHAQFGIEDVVSALNNVLHGQFHDEFDDFISHPINDSNLESIRQNCLDVLRKYPGSAPGKDLSVEAEEWVRKTLHELKTRAE